MAGDKKPLIVIKKITVVAGGAHGGAWKVAFADFMTAMMTFFLVMWLVGQASPSQKQNIADYFSTPSVIEYNFSNFGAELTLEKLFLDLVNEPLKTLTGLMSPADRTPNIMGMGMKKVVMSFMADQLGDIAGEVDINADSVVFEIPDNYLFEAGKATPGGQFVTVMEKIKGVIAGLEDSDVIMTSLVYHEAVPGGDAAAARRVAEERMDLLTKKLEASFEHDTVDLVPKHAARKDDRGPKENRASGGMVRFEIKQKPITADGRKPRPLSDELFSGSKDADASVYENFVKAVSERSKKTETRNR